MHEGYIKGIDPVGGGEISIMIGAHCSYPRLSCALCRLPQMP